MSDRLLAEAWRDLAGWHVGMVDEFGRVRCNTCTRPVDHDTALPALDSPANWGHWAAWALGSGLSINVVPQTPEGSGRFAISVGHRHVTGGFAQALLSAICDEADMAVRLYPPSVLAWWKSQQGEVSGG